MCDLRFPTKDQSHVPCWGSTVLTTGPPGKSPRAHTLNWDLAYFLHRHIYLWTWSISQKSVVFFSLVLSTLYLQKCHTDSGRWLIFNSILQLGHVVLACTYGHTDKGIQKDACFKNDSRQLMSVQFSSVHFSCSVVSDSLRPHESQHARLPCPSPSPGVHWDSRPSSQWCHPAISPSVVPFSSCPQSLPASESFPIYVVVVKWKSRPTILLRKAMSCVINWTVRFLNTRTDVSHLTSSLEPCIHSFIFSTSWFVISD